MEDSASIKKTAEEEKEDEELARAVNATLEAEEKKRKEEEDEKKKVRTPDEKKKDEDRKKRDQEKSKDEKEVRQGEDCLPFNVSCPVIKPCPPQRECPEEKLCEECPPCKSCPKCEEPKECPPVECPPVFCQPCPVVNTTVRPPSTTSCPEASLSVPAAVAVGAVVSLLVTGVAVVIGLILRYVPPIVSGFLFLATIVILWYLCSQYPETARELGTRAATLLREAAVALGHRVMAAVQRHTEQVSVSVKSNLFCIMSSMFQKVCTKIFYVKKINF